MMMLLLGHVPAGKVGYTLQRQPYKHGDNGPPEVGHNLTNAVTVSQHRPDSGPILACLQGTRINNNHNDKVCYGLSVHNGTPYGGTAVYHKAMHWYSV